jgi:hypothetical protein
MLPPAHGRKRATAVTAALLVTLAGSLAGCTDDDPAPSADKSASTSATAASSASGQSPSPSASSTSTGAPRRSGGPLLTAGELPALGSSRWAQGTTTTTEPRQLRPCQRFGILAIGAERVVVRHFEPAGTSVGLERADELVATFPDEMTARRAYSVLESWRKQCGDRLRRYGDPELGDLQPVSVDGGQAAWYLLTYAPNKNAPHNVLLDAQGMAQVGRRIALLRMARFGEKSGDLQPTFEDAVAAAAARLR